MAYFTPAELPDNKYYIFGKDGGKRLAEEYKVPFLGEIPLLKGISDAGDNGFPVAIDQEDPVTKSFLTIAEKVAQQLSIIHSQV
ncbi:Iron-sulfur cluster carrier protein [compost metagenome]